MTEKRFTVHTLIEDYEVGEDDLKGHMIEILDNGNHMTYKECCDLLNELSEENEQLKKRIEHLERKIQRERTSAIKEHEKWEKEVIELIREQRKLIDDLNKENEELKSTIAQLIEQNRKNNDLLLSDIRILEKALWCGGCENDYGRLKELRKEFIR